MKKKSLGFIITLFFTSIVITVVFHSRMHQKPRFEHCSETLSQIDAAKQMWASDKGKLTNDIPSWDDLRPYYSPGFADANNRMWSNGRPVCLSGGIYTIGRVDGSPTCSIGGPYHSLMGSIKEAPISVSDQAEK